MIEKQYMNNDLDAKIKESLLWSTILPVLFQVVRFAGSIIIARILNPKDFGIIGIASVIVFYSNNLANFGFSTALIQRKEITQRHINSVFTIDLILSLVLTLVTCLFSNVIASFFEIKQLRNVFVALSSIFMISTFYTTPITILRRDISYKLVSQIEVVKGTSQLLFTLFFACLGFEYWSLVYGLIISMIISTGVVLYKVKWIPRILIDKTALKEIISFASWNFFSSQMRLLNDYADKLIIGKFLGATSLGYYDKAYSIALMPVESIVNRISGVMFSSFSRSQANTKKLLSYFERILITSSIICFPIFVGFFLVANYFVIVFLGERWSPMVPTFKILLIGLTMSSLSSTINVLNIGIGNYKKQIRIRLYSLIVFIILCFLFVHHSIGMVAIAVFIYHLIFLLFSYNIAKTTLGVSWTFLLNCIFPALAGVIIMGMIVFLLSHYILCEVSLLNLLLLSICGAIVYGCSIIGMNFNQTGFIRDEVKVQLKKLKESIVVRG